MTRRPKQPALHSLRTETTRPGAAPHTQVSVVTDKGTWQQSPCRGSVATLAEMTVTQAVMTQHSKRPKCDRRSRLPSSDGETSPRPGSLRGMASTPEGRRTSDLSLSCCHQDETGRKKMPLQAQVCPSGRGGERTSANENWGREVSYGGLPDRETLCRTRNEMWRTEAETRQGKWCQI